MSSSRRPPGSLARVPSQGPRQASPRRPPPEADSTNRRLAIWLGVVLVVILLLLALVVLGIGPFSRQGPAPTPSTSPTGTRPSQSASPSGTPGPTPTAATPSPKPSSPPPSSAPPSPTPSPTPAPTPKPAAFLGANVSGAIDEGTKGFLQSTLLSKVQLDKYTLTKDGGLKAGSVLGDFSSFATNHGAAVLWQSWQGSGAVRQVSDLRMAFPTTDDASAFLKAFGKQVVAAAAVTSFTPITIGEETRAFKSDTADAGSGAHTVRVVFVFRRGDLVGVSASVVVLENATTAADRATAIARRAGLDLDAAVGNGQ